MPSLIDHYRRKYPHRLAGKTDEEIAIALANANPGIALMDNRVKELFWAAKSRRNIALGIPFESEQVHRALMQEAEPRRRVVTSPENPTPAVSLRMTTLASAEPHPTLGFAGGYWPSSPR